MELILLINNELCDKITAHKNGLQHWAFSVFIFNQANQLFLQKRALNKYHSPNLWTNTCCSHFTDINELDDKENTAKKRLLFELGLDFKGDLLLVDKLEYNADVGNGLIENEVDYIFVGKLASGFDLVEMKKSVNKTEVSDVKFEDISSCIMDVKQNPEKYTEWFKMILNDNEFISKILNCLA